MKCKMIFLALICGVSLSSLSGMNVQPKSSYRVANDAHGVVEILDAIKFNMPHNIKNFYESNKDSAFIAAFLSNDAALEKIFPGATKRWGKDVVQQARNILQSLAAKQ